MNTISMPQSAVLTDAASSVDSAPVVENPTPRKRPPPGERRVQILQTLASMLEQPQAERVTTAALAGQLGVSEAALYRHFASKAQMFESLIDFIEESLFGLVRQITERDPSGFVQAARITGSVLQFSERNLGMTRVMVGDALVHENVRLQQRMTALFDKLESALKQSLRTAMEASGSAQPTVDAQLRANVLVSFIAGRMQRFARSGFRQKPTENLDASIAILMT